MKQTSIEAYHNPITQGKIKTQRERIEEVFENYPNAELTAHDIADLSGLDYYSVQKRVNLVVKDKKAKIVGKKRNGNYKVTTYIRA